MLHKHKAEMQSSFVGIVVAYLPLINHPNVPDVDPDTSPYLSTWNFEVCTYLFFSPATLDQTTHRLSLTNMHTHSQWTPEQINNLTTLAKTNFGEGADQLKRTVRAVYERKKKQRLGREEMDKKQKREREEAEDELAHAENERSHTGHFS